MELFATYKHFKQKRLEKAIAKNQKNIANPKAVRDYRVTAIDFFKGYPTAETAVPALLERFAYNLDHGINDSQEKESAMEGIVSFKEEALPFIVEHLQRSDRIAWPIKALKALTQDESEIIAALASCLDFSEVAFVQKKVDKNYDILCYLRDYKLPVALINKLYHFLDDPDEQVRFAAVETLVEQNEGGISCKLERFLKDDSAENTRIRQSVISAFLRNKWTISDQHTFPVGPLNAEVAVNFNYQLKARR